MKYSTQGFSILLMAAIVSLPAGTARARPDESAGAHSGDKVETRGPNPDHVTAINNVADYLTKMGRKDVSDKLRADFKSGTVYIAPLESGANAEVNPGIIGLWRTMAINSTMINQMGSNKMKAPGANVANWSLTVFHEYVHMNQWLPMEDSSHETPAWAATIRENGQWIRKTLDKIDQAGSNASLTPQERMAQLKDLRQTLADLDGSSDVLLNELREKLAKGDLDRNNKWQGVPPAGGLEATGTTDIDALEEYADAQVQAGMETAGRLIEEAKKGIAAPLELFLQTVKPQRVTATGEWHNPACDVNGKGTLEFWNVGALIPGFETATFEVTPEGGTTTTATGTFSGGPNGRFDLQLKYRVKPRHPIKDLAYCDYIFQPGLRLVHGKSFNGWHSWKLQVQNPDAFAGWPVGPKQLPDEP